MKYLQTKIVLFALIALCSVNMFAQDDEQITIESTILDSNDAPVGGALIKDQQDNTLAISDDFGYFSITVDLDSYISISAPGYKSYTVRVEDEDFGDIILQDGSDDEVQIAFRKVCFRPLQGKVIPQMPMPPFYYILHHRCVHHLNTVKNNIVVKSRISIFPGVFRIVTRNSVCFSNILNREAISHPVIVHVVCSGHKITGIL